MGFLEVCGGFAVVCSGFWWVFGVCGGLWRFRGGSVLWFSVVCSGFQRFIVVLKDLCVFSKMSKKFVVIGGSFGKSLIFHGSLWWSLVVCGETLVVGGGPWWLVVVLGGLWGDFGGWWWSLVVGGGPWWFVVVLGGWWWSLVVCGGPWWLVVVLGGLWWSLVVGGGDSGLWWVVMKRFCEKLSSDWSLENDFMVLMMNEGVNDGGNDG